MNVTESYIIHILIKYIKGANLGLIKKIKSKPNLLLLHGAQLLEQFLQALRKASGIDLQGPVVELFQLATQLEHGLLPIADQFLQVLVAQLLTCPALARALSATFQLCLHIDLFR